MKKRNRKSTNSSPPKVDHATENLQSNSDQSQYLSRSSQMDVLRGIAILGIFWINIIFFSVPGSITDLPKFLGNADDLNTLVWMISAIFVEGSMYAILAILFGAGTLILLDESRSNKTSWIEIIDRYYRRITWLILFGLVNSIILLWPQDILAGYGMLGFLLVPFRKVRPLFLLIIGISLVSLGSMNSSVRSQLFDMTSAAKEIPSFENIPQSVRDEFADGQHQFYEAQTEAAVQLYRSGYAEIFSENLKVAINQNTTSFIEDTFFDAGGVMLIGMALYKWGILQGLRTAGFYLLLMLAGYAIAFAIRIPYVHTIITSDFHPFVLESLYGGFSFYYLSRIFLTLGHIGLIILLMQCRVLDRIFDALAAVGRMALTCYLAQTLFAITLLFGFGFSMYGRFERYELELIAVAFGMAQIGFSLYWLKHYRTGPMEWLWKSLVERGKQPLRREMNRIGTPAL